MCLHPVFGPAKSHKQQVLRQLCIDWVTSTAQWVTCSLVHWKQRKFMFITELTFRHQQGCQITSTISPITKSQCALRDSPGSSHRIYCKRITFRFFLFLLWYLLHKLWQSPLYFFIIIVTTVTTTSSSNSNRICHHYSPNWSTNALFFFLKENFGTLIKISPDLFSRVQSCQN